jgi:hypothetical protein
MSRLRYPKSSTIFLLLGVLILLAYYPVFTADFVSWDDPYHLLTNPHMNPPTLSAIPFYWTHPFLGLYIPVTYSLWTLVGLAAWAPVGTNGVFELNPFLFHTANVFVHFLNAAILFLLLRRLTRDRLAAAVGAAFFAIHPTTAEPVSWLSGFRDLLGTFFTFASLYTYLHFTSANARRWLWYAFSTILYILAVLSKPASVATPLLVATLAILFLHRPARRTILLMLPWIAFAIVIALATRTLQPVPAPQNVPPIYLRPLIAGDCLFFYLSKLFVPLSLAIHYPRTPHLLLSTGLAWKTSLLPLAAILLILFLRKRWLNTVSLLFLFALLPTLGLIPYAYQTFSTVADRYLYLALLAPALAISLLLTRRPPRLVLLIAAILLIPFTILTNLQSRTWHDTESLFTHNLQAQPHSSIALNALANIRLNHDDPVAAESLARAAVLYSEGDPRALRTLGQSLERQGRWQEAQIPYAQAALNGSPTDAAAAYADLASLRAEHGFLADAQALYQKSLSLNPHQPQALEGLARLHQHQ